MDEKIKFKEEVDRKFEIGMGKFDECMKNGQIREWVETYLTHFDEGTQKAIIEYYSSINLK